MAEEYQVPVSPETPDQVVTTEPVTPVVASETRPAWLPEKYNRPEDMVLAHANAEARLTQLSQQLASTKSPTPALDAEGKPVPVVPQAQTPQGVPELDSNVLQGYYDEFSASGALSPGSYMELQTKYGIPAALVDAHIAGLQGQAQHDAEGLYQIVGGKDNYAKMAAWAGRSLSAEERAGYDSMIANANASGDRNLLAMAVKSLATRWQESEGKQRLPVSPTPMPSVSTGAGYTTPEEAAAAVADPKYKTDAAFRQQHYTRLAAAQY